MAFRGEVLDARSRIVKHYRSRPDGLCDVLITTPFDFESTFTDCSRPLSVETCEKGVSERVIEGFLSIDIQVFWINRLVVNIVLPVYTKETN